MKKGFTLIELAITLIIIGLVIGAILVAQSLIQTAKVQGIVKNLQKWEIATNNFYSAYKQFPGDSTLFIPPGNGNRIMTTLFTIGCNGAFADEEVFQFWSHLSQAEMLNETYPPWSPTNCPGGVHPTSSGFNFLRWADPSLNGVVWPYTELDGAKSLVMVGKFGNLSIKFGVDKLEVLPLEAKLGSVSYNALLLTQVGLTNYNGAGKCSAVQPDPPPDPPVPPVDCYSSNALIGFFVYYLPLR